jgi:hypothetical protein
MRHLHLPPDRLIAILSLALDSLALDLSRAGNRGILLPELPQSAGSVHRAL